MRLYPEVFAGEFFHALSPFGGKGLPLYIPFSIIAFVLSKTLACTHPTTVKRCYCQGAPQEER